MSVSRWKFAVVCTLLCGLRCASAQQPLALRDTQELRKQNSRLFVFYSGNSTLNDDVAFHNAKKDEPADSEIVVSRSRPKEGLEGTNANEKSREAYILGETANSDLIVVGEPVQQNSSATEGGRFIFSDYEVAVDRILSARGVTVLAGQTIVVTRPGGILQYRGRTLVGSVPGYDLFSINQPYMMFLRLLPNGTFLELGESAYNLNKEQIEIDPDRGTKKNVVKTLIPKAQFVEDVERAIRRLDKAAN